MAEEGQAPICWLTPEMHAASRAGLQGEANDLELILGVPRIAGNQVAH